MNAENALLDRALAALPCAAAQESTEGLRQVVLSPPGRVESLSGEYLLDRQAGDEIVAAFDRHSIILVVDYEHQTLGKTFSSPDGRAPAAGWIHKIWFDDRMGLLGLVRWNARARDTIRAGEYKFLSPVLLIRKSDGRAVALHSVGLTNKPAIPHMSVLAASARLDAELVARASDDNSSMGLLRRIAAVLKLSNVKKTQEVLEAALAKLESLLGGEQEGDEGTSSAENNRELPMAETNNELETATPDQLLEKIVGLLRDKGIEVSAEDRAAVLGAVIELLRGDSTTEQASKAVASRVREVLSLPADAGADEVVLAMTTRDTTGASTELAGMREAERKKWAQERVDHYVKVNVINPNNQDSMTAAMSLAREDPKRFEALMGGAIAGELDVMLHFALPYSPWSKSLVERWFRTLEERGVKPRFASYTGNSPADKPECVDQIAPPTLDQLRPLLERERDHASASSEAARSSSRDDDQRADAGQVPGGLGPAHSQAESVAGAARSPAGGLSDQEIRPD